MATDLISRKAALELLDDHWYKRIGTTNPFDWEVCNELKDIIEEAEDLEIVYFEPVRHGEWRTFNLPKKWNGSTLRCSECNTGTTWRWNYCPNCGAKMDGGKENG